MQRAVLWVVQQWVPVRGWAVQRGVHSAGWRRVARTLQLVQRVAQVWHRVVRVGTHNASKNSGGTAMSASGTAAPLGRG
jgi:hypothetical protein